jgi:O-antigen ligase
MRQLQLLKHGWFWGFSLLFILVNAGLLMQGYLQGFLLPVLLILALFGIFSFDKLLLLTVFCTPLSIRLEHVIGGVGLDLPTDLLVAALAILIFFKFLADEKFDKQILKNPITIILLINMGWILFTSITSSMPSVSLKYFMSRSWYVLLFYFIGSQYFKSLKGIRTWIWAYLIPLAGVILYTINEHSKYNFDQRASYGVSSPFYINHGIYAAALTMFIPFLWYAVTRGNLWGYSIFKRSAIGVVLMIFLAGLLYSFTRASWLSLAGAIALGVIIVMRLRTSTYILGAVLLIAVAFGVQEKLQQAVNKNKQVSADSFEKHVKSIYNIKNDDSNLERINRWKCAWRMFSERPILGFGPGTYMFQYAPFQRAKEITKISTNLSTLGNCHSEYLQPLAEGGILGFLSWLALIVILVIKGARIFLHSLDPGVKILAMSIMLGLVTYFIHGFLNNYSDLDKAAVLIWSFAGILTALDTYHYKGRQSLKNIEV